jgi:hypothetical protein
MVDLNEPTGSRRAIGKGLLMPKGPPKREQ